MPNAPVIRRSLFALAVLALFGFLIWASDTITLQGERTIYTANCEHGAWKDLRCTGKMVAGDRYRYRASTSRNEVIFWVAGLPKPSGRYTDCEVRNRGNWSCNATHDDRPSITRQMTNDRATHGPAEPTVSFHAVPKWKWWLLRAGLATIHEAEY
jgi:hypothetical protein